MSKRKTRKRSDMESDNPPSPIPLSKRARMSSVNSSSSVQSPEQSTFTTECTDSMNGNATDSSHCSSKESEPITILVTINELTESFPVSKLSKIKYFRDKWTGDPLSNGHNGHNGHSKLISNATPITISGAQFDMTCFSKMVQFANQPKDKSALRKLELVNTKVLMFFKCCHYFGVHESDKVMVPMLEEYYDSAPAVPGIAHKMLSAWYHSKNNKSAPFIALARFAGKKMTEIYQLFGLPNVQRAIDVMNQFRTESSSLYDAQGALLETVTRENVLGMHYEFTVNFVHFYQCLVWTDFNNVIQSVCAVIRDFTAFATSDVAAENTISTDRFETFPFHEILFCVLCWIRKLKQYYAQAQAYVSELRDILQLIPPLMEWYWRSQRVQREWHPDMPYIVLHYFPKMFVWEEGKESEIQSVSVKSDEQSNDPYFGSLGMELYKCIMIETMQFQQHVDYAMNEMLKPLLMHTFGRDEQWLEKRLLPKITQKHALRVSSMVYHEVINRFQLTGANGVGGRLETNYHGFVDRFSGMVPLKMFQAIAKHRAERREEQKMDS